MDCSSGQINVLYSCTKSDKKDMFETFHFPVSTALFWKNLSGFLNPCLLWLYLVVLCKIFVIVIYMILFVTSPALKRDCIFVQGVYSSVKLRNSPSGFGLSEVWCLHVQFYNLLFSLFFISHLCHNLRTFFFFIFTFIVESNADVTTLTFDPLRSEWAWTTGIGGG